MGAAAAAEDECDSKLDDVIEDISEIKAQMKQIICILQSDEPNYRFELTQSSGTWNQVRQQCKNGGGDLLHKNFGPQGSKYHAKIRALQQSAVNEDKRLWVGLTDETTEGRWKYLDGKFYDAESSNVFEWASDQPNDRTWGNCAYIFYGDNLMYDYTCGWTSTDSPYGICEIRANPSCN